MGLDLGIATHFRWAASPLISGWRFLGTAPVNLLLIKAAKLGGAGTLAAALIGAALLGALAWSALRIRAALRGPLRPAGGEAR